MNLLKFTLYLATTSMLLFSCNKDEEIIPAATGTAQLEITHKYGTDDLILDTVTYSNAASETFTISRLKYYVSNIQLTKDDSTVYSEAESYHLVDLNVKGSPEISLANIPTGNYSSITFMIGVDSLRNVSGAQTGALDPLYDMFWSWNQGYIFFKLEGNCDQVGGFNYHIGGYAGKYAAQRTITFSFGSTKLIVANGKTPQINLHADMETFFSNPNVISIVDLPNPSNTGATASMMADQYANMFSFDSIVN